MKVALVHDYLNQKGGAERVFLALTELFPTSPVFTSIYFSEKTYAGFQKRKIRTTFAQKIPGIDKSYRLLFFLYPPAFSTLGDFSGADVVISSSSTFAKWITPRPDICHICYCHSPTRFLYDYDRYMAQFQLGFGSKTIVRALTRFLQYWDQQAANRVHYFIANSRFTAQKIKEHYRKDAIVIYPPVDTKIFRPGGQKEDYYLVVSRFLNYKRIDLAIEAFRASHRRLVIVGEGPDEKRLKRLATGLNVDFAGPVSTEKLVSLYQSARALILPGEEDFGMVPVEAGACGTPTIAYRRGGAMETVIEGKTGIFFDQGTPASLADAVSRFELLKFSPDALIAHARQFDITIFRQKILDAVHDFCRTFGSQTVK